MFGLSLGHLVILLVIVLLVRARKLPQIADSFHKTITNFKRGLHGEKLVQTPKSAEKAGVREADDILPSDKKS